MFWCYLPRPHLFWGSLFFNLHHHYKDLGIVLVLNVVFVVRPVPFCTYLDTLGIWTPLGRWGDQEKPPKYALLSRYGIITPLTFSHLGIRAQASQ
jgi:hypothetical protein